MEQPDEFHKGPRRKFGAFHIYKAVSEVAVSGRTGRARISEALGIGEGSVRTLLDRLEDLSLIKRSNAGIVLTQKGKSLFERLPFTIKRMRQCALLPGPFSSIAVVRRASDMVTTGIAQRDAAIKNGGDGAITMIVRGGKLLLPPDLSAVDDSTVNDAAFSDMRVLDGDAVIISSARTPILSEQATFFAAATLF